MANNSRETVDHVGELVQSTAPDPPNNLPSVRRLLDGDDDGDEWDASGNAGPGQTRVRLLEVAEDNLAEDVEKDEESASEESDDEGVGQGFLRQLEENGIFTPEDSSPPENLDDIVKRLTAGRQSPPPPEPVYKLYNVKVERARTGTTIMQQMAAKVLKEYDNGDGDDDGYTMEFNQAYNSLSARDGFNNGLPPPQPGLVEGIRLEKIWPIPIDAYSGTVIHRGDLYSVTMPHLAGEFLEISSGEGMPLTMGFGRYCGAALCSGRARGMQFAGVSEAPRHAQVLTFTTDGRNVHIYAHYCLTTSSGKTEYHQYPVATANLESSYQNFLTGVTLLRNAQDFAREASFHLMDEVRQRWEAKARTSLEWRNQHLGDPCPRHEGQQGRCYRLN